MREADFLYTLSDLLFINNVGRAVGWDGTNNLGMRVASGIYIYGIQAESFMDIKKLEFLQ